METGVILADKYKIISKLGGGGCGAVYLAEDLIFGKLWAIKISSEIEDGQLEVMQKINNKRIPLFIDSFCENGRRAFVMEYIEGETVAKYLKRNALFPRDEGVKAAIEILEIIKHIHNLIPPIIYGDLKPSNIIIDNDGEVHLIDIDSALINAQSGKSYGTLGYAAPEQVILNQKSVVIDKRADIYSFGILLYEMLTGESPIDDKGLKQMSHPAIRGKIGQIIQRCLYMNKEMRYQNVEDVLAELKTCLQKEKIQKRCRFLLNGLNIISLVLCLLFFNIGFYVEESFYYISGIMWIISFVCLKFANKRPKEFLQGDGVRVMATSKRTVGFIAILALIILMTNRMALDAKQNTEYYKNTVKTHMMTQTTYEKIYVGKQSLEDEGKYKITNEVNINKNEVNKNKVNKNKDLDSDSIRDAYGRKVLIKQ